MTIFGCNTTILTDLCRNCQPIRMQEPNDV